MRHTQSALGGSEAHHRIGTTLAIRNPAKAFQILRHDSQYVTLLRFIAPDFSGRQAGFLDGYAIQLEYRTTPCIVDQLGESIGQTAGPDIVDRQNRIAGAGRKSAGWGKRV